jgi:hypothetical protein
VTLQGLWGRVHAAVACAAPSIVPQSGMGWHPHEVLPRLAADARDTTRGRRGERWAHPDVAHNVCGAMDHDRLTATALGLTLSPAAGRGAC